jgi:hypothetical protein
MMEVKLLEADVVRRMADILGASSAASKALAEQARRKAEGEDAFIFLTPTGSLLVGPMI